MQGRRKQELANISEALTITKGLNAEQTDAEQTDSDPNRNTSAIDNPLHSMKNMKRFALFVGINKYPENSLSYARKDAEALYKVFARQYDEAKLLVDKKATKTAIIRELKALKEKASPGDMLLFFFSGHGADGYYERLLAIPSSRRGFDLDVIHTNDLARDTNLRGLHRLFVLDCCRVHGEMESEIGKGLSADAKAPSFVSRQNRKSIVNPTILSSSSPGQMSFESQSAGHGFFTKAILEALGDPDVQNFNTFRNSLGASMQKIDSGGYRGRNAQIASIEGPIDADLPFWPAWDGTASSEWEKPAQLQRPRRRRHDAPELSGSGRNLKANDVYKAFQFAATLSKYLYLKNEFIPDSKLDNAYSSMAVDESKSGILALYDDTVFGGSREGFVITKKGIYAKNIWEEPTFVAWGSIDNVSYDSNRITINDVQINAADMFLSMPANEAVYNGIMDLEEIASGNKFNRGDDCDEDDGNDGGDDKDDDGDEDGDEWAPDPELLRQVNALLRKH